MPKFDKPFGAAKLASWHPGILASLVSTDPAILQRLFKADLKTLIEARFSLEDKSFYGSIATSFTT